jgi:hypothetical protein
VYEYHVEPTTLQDLPDCALLLADRSGRAMRLRAVECDPSIMTLPEASTGPLRHPGSVQYDEPAAVANTAGNTAGNAAGNTIGNAADQDGQAITPPAQRPDGWAPAQPPPAAEPAWLPDAEVRDIPWWQRNQPPEQRP